MMKSGWASVTAVLGLSVLGCVNELKTPVLGACGEGQFVKKTSDGWACTALGEGGVDASKTPIVDACQAGQAVRKSSTGWECFTPAGGEGIDSTKTPVVGTCAEGQLVQRTAIGWSCVTVDVAGLLARLETAEAKVAGLDAIAARLTTVEGKLAPLAFIQLPPSTEAGAYRLMGDGSWLRGTTLANTQVFDADGAFVVPEGVTTVSVEMWSGGSGGSGATMATSSSLNAGRGGEGGTYAGGYMSVTPGATIAIVVGQGGVASAPGSASYFGSVLTTQTSSGSKVAGGTQGAKAIFTKGAPGLNGICHASAFNSSYTSCVGGVGGAAAGGGGEADTAPGGGGSGNSTGAFYSSQSISTSGRPGADGRVVVSW
jgi:hypothetical protein